MGVWIWCVFFFVSLSSALLCPRSLCCCDLDFVSLVLTRFLCVTGCHRSRFVPSFPSHFPFSSSPTRFPSSPINSPPQHPPDRPLTPPHLAAFHWTGSDGAAAVDEIARVLKPGGTWAKIWNLEDGDKSEWVRKNRELYEEFEAGASGLLAIILFCRLRAD